MAALAIIVAAGLQGAVVLHAQLATVDRVQSPGWWPTKGTASRNDYIGAAACAQCHAAQAATQPATSMARTAISAEKSDVLRASQRLKFSNGPYTYEIVTNDRESIYSVSDGTHSASAPLRWAFGVGKVGQSFLFERNGAFHEARVSYYDSIRALEFTPARAMTSARDLDEAMARRVGESEVRRCFSCHTTAPIDQGKFDPAGATPGVTCEACHGPGRHHVDAMKQKRIAEARASILNPAKLEPADSVDFCGACHAAFFDVKLADQRGIAALRSQPYRLLSSRCWNEGDARLTCIACHNPHRPLARDPVAYDARCLSCHATAAGQATSERQSRTCKAGNTNKCVTCHMPKYEVREMHHEFTDHLIRVPAR